MKKFITPGVIAVVVILAAIRLMANRDRIVTQHENLTIDFVSVSVTPVAKRNASSRLNWTGVSCPRQELDVAAETSGRITELDFELGRQVRKGDTLAAIDDQTIKRARDTARLDADRLKKDLDRMENLFRGGTATEQQLDNARSSYETAKNRLDDAERQVSFTRVTAPIGGTVVRKIAEQGAYVKPGDPIASIVDVSRLKVKVNASESEIYRLRAGQDAAVTTDVYPDAVFDGKIRFISPRGDEAHNYPVEIEVINRPDRPLKAGTFVHADVTVGSDRQGLFIPREALQGSVKDAKVYVAEQGKAALKSIVIGRESDESLEVLSGLNEGDRVVTSGQVNLADGKPIKIIDTH